MANPLPDRLEANLFPQKERGGWTKEQDKKIRDMKAQDKSWKKTGQAVGKAKKAVMYRNRELQKRKQGKDNPNTEGGGYGGGAWNGSGGEGDGHRSEKKIKDNKRKSRGEENEAEGTEQGKKKKKKRFSSVENAGMIFGIDTTSEMMSGGRGDEGEDPKERRKKRKAEKAARKTSQDQVYDVVSANSHEAAIGNAVNGNGEIDEDHVISGSSNVETSKGGGERKEEKKAAPDSLAACDYPDGLAGHAFEGDKETEGKGINRSADGKTPVSVEKSFLVPASLLITDARKKDALLRTIFSGCGKTLAKDAGVLAHSDPEVDLVAESEKEPRSRSAVKPRVIVQTATRKPITIPKSSGPKTAKAKSKSSGEDELSQLRANSDVPVNEPDPFKDDQCQKKLGNSTATALGYPTKSPLCGESFYSPATDFNGTWEVNPGRIRGRVHIDMNDDAEAEES
jgi:hypothetical protein